MGDLVDKEYYKLETFTHSLTLKARYPDRIAFTSIITKRKKTEK
jgi:hypothetical protein